MGRPPTLAGVRNAPRAAVPTAAPTGHRIRRSRWSESRPGSEHDWNRSRRTATHTAATAVWAAGVTVAAVRTADRSTTAVAHIGRTARTGRIARKGRTWAVAPGR